MRPPVLAPHRPTHPIYLPDGLYDRFVIAAAALGVDPAPLLESILVGRMVELELADERERVRSACACCPAGCAHPFGWRGAIRCGCAPAAAQNPTGERALHTRTTYVSPDGRRRRAACRATIRVPADVCARIDAAAQAQGSARYRFVDQILERALDAAGAAPAPPPPL